MIKIKEVKPLKDYKLWLQFEDGVEGIVDISHLKGKGVFRVLENENNFNAIQKLKKKLEKQSDLNL